ncbi:cell division protein FtsQ/DivIB [Bifidobacterium saguinibicoloris]|uniref:cell division protein FtsQ/DivIB n=1 Tax=Bifidobacterium saguinibicoloris TaxID=2834433 RepID=UPI001C58319F|nr:FtsQ-type POTRA domain-containing protein [Bifidobacterium saguinibicoloris]MBW3081540.1 FtsQ-type POTRA domain-containing protein [Bifidobacterium saguinibicoloris]
MAGRVVSSGGAGAGSADGSSKPRRDGGVPERRPRRTVSGTRGRDGNGGRGVADSKTQPGAFVDARRLRSEDLVAKTLKENSGALGLVTRPKIVDFTARARERKHATVRVMALRILAIVLAVAAVTGLGWLLLLSPVLRLDSSQVTVQGANEWVSETDIRSIVDEQAGKSLLLVNTQQMTDSMGSIPGVTSAKATKQYPHGLAVTIKAQRPAAMLKETGSDSLTAVDSQARVLNSVAGASATGIPVIEVSSVEKGLKNRAVKETLKVLDSLPESLRGKITKVTADTQDSVTTELEGGKHVIVWGDSSDMKLKKAVVDKILSDPNVIGDKTQVDVSAPLRPVLR